MATKYVLYSRVSSEEQGKSGLGLEAQQRDIDLFPRQLLRHAPTKSLSDL